jgi:predicted nucleic acid-binding protein
LTIYADSSFLVSGYVQDVHSAEAVRRLALLPSLWITPLNRSEIAHAIHRYVFRGVISAAQANRDWHSFQQDCRKGTFISIDFPERVWEASIDLARRYGSTLGVRTLDSLHVACALELRADRFWTFDDRQSRLAEAVGLDIKA